MRMVAVVRSDYPSEWAAIGAVAQKLGIGSWEEFGRSQRPRTALNCVQLG